MYMKYVLYCMVYVSLLENIFNIIIIRIIENEGEDFLLLIIKDVLLNNYIGRVVWRNGGVYGDGFSERLCIWCYSR